MKLLTSIAAVAAISVGSMASAASWDFAQDAEDFFDDNGYEGTFAQVYADTGGIADGGGITVDASAVTHPTGDSEFDPHPFMDSRGNDNAQGGPGDDFAGLGVCSSGFDIAVGQSACSTNYSGDFDANPGDDNLVFEEILELTFSKSVRIRDLLVRDAKHDPMNGKIAIITDLAAHAGGAPLPLFDVVNGVVQGVADAGFASVFYFSSDPAADTNGAKGQNGEIYLSTLTASVPLPAAGWMLIAGLGGIAAMRRKKS